jgi:hypothetical protein
VHAGLAAALAIAALLALYAGPGLAPAALMLFAPLTVLATVFWAVPGLLGAAAVSAALLLFKQAQLQGQPGYSRGALWVEALVLAGVAGLAWWFHRRAAAERLMQADSAGDADREVRELFQEMEKERVQLEHARARAERLEGTRTLTAALERERDFDTRLDMVCRALLDMAGGGEAWVLVPEAAGLHAVRCFSMDGPRQADAEAGDFDQWVAGKRMGLLVSDIEKDIRFRGAGGGSLRSIASAPVTRGDQVVAVLRLSSGKVNAYSHEDLRLLTLLCEVLAASDGLPTLTPQALGGHP